MKLRRRLTIRVETSARQIALFAFWLRNGCGPIKAWQKAQVTL